MIFYPRIQINTNLISPTYQRKIIYESYIFPITNNPVNAWNDRTYIFSRSDLLLTII